MKLTDANPEFYDEGGYPQTDGTVSPRREGAGIIFDCPCGQCGDDRRLAIPFKNPMVGATNERGWVRDGETFETLTLSPSILRMEGCRWHGFLRAGVFVPC